jgi:pimeloyl-ACP methyl ester carboxylesterase
VSRARKVLLPALVVAVIAVLLLALVWALQRRFIYFPDTAQVPSASSVMRGARDVRLHTEDGLTLGAWVVPAETGRRGVSVLVANGNGGDRSDRAPLARALAAEGMTVLLFDYRGYGGNPGSPSEAGLARDVRAALNFLLEETGTSSDHVIYYGESLGSAVVTELAATGQPPDGLLLRSPFVDLASVGEVHYPFIPVRAFLRDRYALAKHLAHLDVPVTVVYGSEDAIVPPAQSRAVAEVAPRLRRLVEVEGAGHNSLVLLNGNELIDAVVDLADLVEQGP